MKQIFPILVIAAMLFTACEQNAPAKRGTGNNKALDSAVFQCIVNGEEYDLVYSLSFDTPYKGVVSDGVKTIWHIEPTFIDNTPFVWEYSFDGATIELKKFRYDGYTTIYATYRNDTIFYGNRAYNRK